ncbi:unnamed protein product, partial [Brassica oleracea var. botrytis]
SSEEDAHSAHTYILLNCEDPLMRYFESMFVSQVEETFPGISTSDVDKRKDQHFVKWLKNQTIRRHQRSAHYSQMFGPPGSRLDPSSLPGSSSAPGSSGQQE